MATQQSLAAAGKAAVIGPPSGAGLAAEPGSQRARPAWAEGRTAAGGESSDKDNSQRAAARQQRKTEGAQHSQGKILGLNFQMDPFMSLRDDPGSMAFVASIGYGCGSAL